MFWFCLADFPGNQLSNHCARFSSLGSADEPVTQDHCNSISPLVGGRWKKLLRNLDIAEVPTIENIDKDYKHETVDEKCYQGLLMWMRSCGTQTATTKKLCDALRQTGCSEALEALSKAGTGCRITVLKPLRALIYIREHCCCFIFSYHGFLSFLSGWMR